MDELSEIRQHVLRFSPDALVVVDDHGVIRFANDTVRGMFGYDLQQLLGRQIDVLIPARLRGRHGQHLASYMGMPDEREMAARIADLFALRADGTEFAAGIRLSPFRINGRLFVAAAIRDTTEQRSINQELRAARQEADRANRAKSRFLATASHDLRQPLQTVLLLNAAMLKVVPQPELHELLKQQSQAIESMTRLLNALLDISRLESGTVEPMSEKVALSRVFAGLRSEFGSVAQSRGIGLQIDDGALVIATDRTLFQQLLQNLLGNALKYTDRGSVRVLCLADEKDEKDEKAVTIAIEDTGVGIPADKLERIFDAYYQVDTHGAKRMGVGLGLAIVREVARLLGFSIEIASVVGKGTQVRVVIPRRFVIAQSVPASGPIAARSSTHARGKVRLILIEDNDGVRLATQTFLRIEGHETLSAASITEAQRLFAELSPDDVVIADYHLDSRHTGLDLLLRLRGETGYDVPGVILSGDLPTVLRTIRLPVANCRFLSKPVDTAALVAAIEDLGAVSRSSSPAAGTTSG